MFWNIIGIVVIILFTSSVDWSLWFSIPVGILLAMLVALVGGYLKATLVNKIKYGE